MTANAAPPPQAQPKQQVQQRHQNSPLPESSRGHSTAAISSGASEPRDGFTHPTGLGARGSRQAERRAARRGQAGRMQESSGVLMAVGTRAATRHGGFIERHDSGPTPSSPPGHRRSAIDTHGTDSSGVAPTSTACSGQALMRDGSALRPAAPRLDRPQGHLARTVYPVFRPVRSPTCRS